MDTKKKSSFSGSIGFVLSAAGSAVGVGNIWRFPYLAAKDGGGLFLIIYFVLVLTFGFTLLTTDVAIGRKTKQNALKAFGTINKKWNFLGYLTFLVPALIMTYYSVIGGWVTKYIVAYLTASGSEAAQDGYFTSFITSKASPVVFMLIFLAATAFIVYRGVEKGIEQFSRIIMPGLIFMIMGIAFFSLTLKYTDGNGVTRTGLQGLGVYIIPNLEGITFKRFLEILLDAMSQLFFSLSVSMGIMITYGSYVKKEVNLNRSLSQIEFFDTGVAFLAGLMIIPAVFVFSGTEGMASGPSLMFVSLPKVFDAMGKAGSLIGLVFFIMVAFAALTSCISIMETLVANCMELFHRSRRQMSLTIGILFAGAAAVICMGYNVFYFEMPLPNGQTAQLLDLMDYISNSFLMPFISLLTCIFVGWIIKPSWINEEMEVNGNVFKRKKMYAFMIRYVTPVMMTVLFLQSAGIFTVIRGWFG
ncbi:sodium-dependent transporter [Enterocloster citroniae]|uniref:sodium-dependent transporter n=1 Tax=Enterocloster citroniae TaxID=358743 RepID=UPI0032C04F61